jgi:integrase
LRAHLKTHPGTGLLFPSESGGMVKDVRASLESAVVGAEIDKRVTLTTLRHTYGATRIQMLDQGAPVHLFTVAREMGHRSVTMIEKHYGHLQNVRHRKAEAEYVDNVVEFNVEAKGA